MRIASIAGSMIVTFALVFYSLGYINERKGRLITSRVLFFYTIGVSLDITAPIFMIMGSSRGLRTLPGFIGYSSLLGMLTDTVMLWRHNLKEGAGKYVSRRLQLFSGVTYTWWIIAYITGGLLVAISKLLARS